MANIPLNLILSMKDQASGVAGKVTSSLGGIAKAGLAIGGVAVAGVAALGGAVLKLGLDAAALEPAKNTFDNLATSIDTTSDALMSDLREATRGMVSDADLIASGNQLMAMGLATTADEAADLTEMATQLGAAMGGEATDSIENFSLMLANQSIPRLDSFGISSGQVRTRIEELIATGQAADREEAFKLAVLEIGQETMAKVGDQSNTLAGDMARAQASFANTKQTIGEVFLPIMSSLASAVLPLVTQAMEKVIPIAQAFGVWLGENIPLAIEAIKPVAEAVFGWIQTNVVPILAQVVDYVVESWPQILATVMSVINPMWDLIQLVITGLVTFWTENHDEIMAVVLTVWGYVQTTIENVIKIIQAIIKTVTAAISGDWEAVWEGVLEILDGIWLQIQNVVETAVNLVKGVFAIFGVDLGAVWDSILETAATVWGKIESAIVTPISDAWDRISGIVDSIMKAFSNIKFPHIPLPHFTVNWKNVLGVQLPTGVSVDWYAKGLDTVFNSPTLIGVGEAGAERVTVTPLGRGNRGGGGDGGMTLTYIDQRPNGGAPDLMAVARGLEWRKRMGVRA